MNIPRAVWNSLENNLRIATGKDYNLTTPKSLSGGDINQAYRITFGDTDYFCKFNTQMPDDFFEVEALALQLFTKVNAILCPRVVLVGSKHSYQYLVLEHLSLHSQGDAANLGLQLATLHKKSIEFNPTQGMYGLNYHNYIGSTPQNNTPQTNWTDFWIEQRLKPQLDIAESNGYRQQLAYDEETFFKGVRELLDAHNPEPSLLHGDLWAGNKSYDENGKPIVYDPAIYFGDRETDIALTELFGRFDPVFYKSYNAAWPLSAGYEQRSELYNLYHLLNHLNLFGSGYLGGCMRVIAKISMQRVF